jgi:hypothetical protein
MEGTSDEHVVARPRVACQSKIVGVVVHSRGAVVTRRIEVEDPLPAASFDLVIDDVTPLADPGSVRVQLPEEGRRLVAVNARWAVPEVDDGPGDTVERLEKLNRRIDQMRERESTLRARAQRLRDFMPAPVGHDAIRDDGPVARVSAAIEIATVVRDMLGATDRRLIELRKQIRELEKERDQAALEDAQASSSDRMGSGHPRRTFEMHVAGGAGDIDGAEFSYAVPHAAKWWPMYSLRLTDGGQRATLALEAVVAQRTGEDWDGVPIGLSTSEIVFDATLPRLPSLRLGKRQRPQRSGFREPPAGTDRLFEGYDAFRGRYETPSSAPKTPTRREKAAKPAPAPLAEPQMAMAADAPAGAPRDATTDHESLEEITGSYPEFDRIQAAQAPPPAKARKRSRSMMGAVGGAIAEGVSAAANAVTSHSGYGAGGAPPPEPPPPEFEPGEHWLAFDSLVLAGPNESRRGKLRHRSDDVSVTTSDLYDARESARRLHLVDPAVSRGLFDYRYDSDGAVQVPADGALHRVELQRAEGESRLVWRTVPQQDPAVYREAELNNPFSSPLLAGPVDVFSEGQLVTTTHIDRVDSGGSMTVGLGVDDRFRVARNVRMTEESAGLLGGKRELIHHVEIELRSALGFPATVAVFDRIPRSDDETVSVELVSADPPAAEYDQSDRNAPIDGGMRWKIALEEGGRETIRYRYEVCLRSRDEIVGGNRRD